MQQKLTIIDSQHVGKQNTQFPSKNAVNDLYDATLCSVHFFGYSAYWTICLFLAFVHDVSLKGHLFVSFITQSNDDQFAW